MQNWHRKSDNSGGKVRRRDSVFPQEPKDVFRDFLRVHVHGEVLEREVQVLGHSGVDKPLVVLRRRPGRQCYKTFFLRHWRGCQKARMFVPPVFQACLLLFVTKAEEFQSYGQRSGQIIRLAGKTWRCQTSLLGSFSDKKDWFIAFEPGDRDLNERGHHPRRQTENLFGELGSVLQNFFFPSTTLRTKKARAFAPGHNFSGWFNVAG